MKASDISQKISQTQKSDLNFPEVVYTENNEEAPNNPRSVMRKDLAICWLDQSQQIKEPNIQQSIRYQKVYQLYNFLGPLFQTY